jgi:hypothetical protein
MTHKSHVFKLLLKKQYNLKKNKKKINTHILLDIHIWRKQRVLPKTMSTETRFTLGATKFETSSQVSHLVMLL